MGNTQGSLYYFIYLCSLDFSTLKAVFQCFKLGENVFPYNATGHYNHVSFNYAASWCVVSAALGSSKQFVFGYSSILLLNSLPPIILKQKQSKKITARKGRL